MAEDNIKDIAEGQFRLSSLPAIFKSAPVNAVSKPLDVSQHATADHESTHSAPTSRDALLIPVLRSTTTTTTAVRKSVVTDVTDQFTEATKGSTLYVDSDGDGDRAWR